MTGILMTQVSTPIIGQAAWLLGKIMDGIFLLFIHVSFHLPFLIILTFLSYIGIVSDKALRESLPITKNINFFKL